MATQRPELVEAVVCVGGPPVARNAFEGAEGMASSEVVVNALLDMAQADYRAALRTVITSANPQMTEDEIRTRVAVQSEYAAPDVSLSRLRAWTKADSTEHSKALGDRLWIVHWPGFGGGWFPSGRELREVLARALPESHLVQVDDGMVSRPDQTAVVRRISSATGAARS